MSTFYSLFGSQYYHKKGFIAEEGKSEFNHRFGGCSWEIVDTDKIGYGSTLILSIDLNDPSLSQLKDNNIREIPFCAYLNCIGIDKQEYQFNPDRKIVTYIGKRITDIEVLPDHVLLPNPLPEKKLHLRPMMKSDYPLDEESYWKCTSDFIGGHSIIRVLGPPVWLQEVKKEICDCGKEMEYVCGVGYEVDNEYHFLLDDKPFFPGELAHYFFLCKDCLKIAVILQST